MYSSYMLDHLLHSGHDGMLVANPATGTAIANGPPHTIPGTAFDFP